MISRENLDFLWLCIGCITPWVPHLLPGYASPGVSLARLWGQGKGATCGAVTCMLHVHPPKTSVAPRQSLAQSLSILEWKFNRNAVTLCYIQPPVQRETSNGHCSHEIHSLDGCYRLHIDVIGLITLPYTWCSHNPQIAGVTEPRHGKSGNSKQHPPKFLSCDLSNTTPHLENLYVFKKIMASICIYVMFLY